MKPIQYNRIKAALAEKKVTNKKLASQLSVEPQTVSRWCTNQNQPSIETLYEIAKALKIDIRDLLVSTTWK
ncbi:helix-turn-helix transcriptional regulator [Terrimonas alba]|uniref:helix-turn-helix transcriptional regulator n=1 Tax=Terrimonas alba TaxID=3349636 RepID=UPI0035F30E54